MSRERNRTHKKNRIKKEVQFFNSKAAFVAGFAVIMVTVNDIIGLCSKIPMWVNAVELIGIILLYDDAIYGYNGHQLGWFEEGWIRDLGGRCVFFTENTNGYGPVKPVKHVKPVKSVRYVKPVKSARCAKYAKAVKSLSWSSLSGRAFFIQ